MMETKLIRKGIIGRLLKTILKFYPVMMPVTIVCIIFSAIVSAVPTIFMQKIIAVIEEHWEIGEWSAISKEITAMVVVLAGFYVLSLLAGIVYNQLMAIITQGSLKKLRSKMFNGMQLLPIKYFDTNNHGDIMSHYTNDIDTLRQLISQSLPQLLLSGITLIAIFCIMVYYCLWLTLVVLLGVSIMLLVTKKVGGGSARYFFRQQTALGKVEGFSEEMMNGQKVVKVFCHEDKSEADFARLNEQLFDEAVKANKYANTLIPILNNIGNVLYVIVAVVGGILMLCRVPNVSISGLAMNISIVVPFLNMTKQFVGAIRYGKLDATDEECIAAAKLAGADDFITRLPSGYQTVLSGNGANMSQGQRQLISIARAAVADPPVMILDEATSSIDTRTEAIVQRGMDALMEGRTVFVIAHRLSTVKNSNVIIVLDHGKIIERGDHDDLIAQKGQYYQLYTGAFELE